MKLNTMENKLKTALSHNIWLNHQIGNEYQMDGKPDKWKIAYYPLFEDGKTNEVYDEPRALVEKPIFGKLDEKIGTDFREVPLRYLTSTNNRIIMYSYKCKKCGSIYSISQYPLSYSNCVVNAPITQERCNGELVFFSNNYIK